MSGYINAGGLITLGTLLPVLGFVMVVLRFYTRRQLQKARWLIDDWLILLAEVLLIALGVCLLVGVAGHGPGYKVPSEINGVPFNIHTSNASVEILTNKVSYILLMLQCLQLGFVKLSILFFYRRLFCTDVTGTLNVATIITIVLTIIWSIAFFFANLFECGTQFWLNWTPTEEQIEDCIQEQWMNEGYVISDFILDVVIFVMPISTVVKLNMSLRKRFAVILILALGAFAIVTSIIKVVIIVQLVHETESPLLSSDPDILTSILLFWSMLESGIATIVACLPTLRSLAIKSPDFIRSLRSMFSLDSMTSNVLRPRTRDNSPPSEKRSISPQAQFNKTSDLEVGTGTMKELQNHSPIYLVPEEATVKSAIVQSSVESV